MTEDEQKIIELQEANERLQVGNRDLSQANRTLRGSCKALGQDLAQVKRERNKHFRALGAEMNKVIDVKRQLTEALNREEIAVARAVSAEQTVERLNTNIELQKSLIGSLREELAESYGSNAVCTNCDGSGSVDTGIGLMLCGECDGSGSV